MRRKLVRRDDNDKVVCKDVEKGSFSVKSFYAALKVGREVLFPMNIIQNLWVSSKVSFFAWEASWGKVLTSNNL